MRRVTGDGETLSDLSRQIKRESTIGNVTRCMTFQATRMADSGHVTRGVKSGRHERQTKGRCKRVSATRAPFAIRYPLVTGFAISCRISRSFAFTFAAFSGPRRIMNFWPAERDSSRGSAYK